VLVLAGLEPEGRAGLLADAAAVAEQGAVPACIATALTAQGRRTFRVEPASAAMVAAQVRAALELGPVRAVKVGMVPDARALARARALVPGVPWVVDPVVRTSRGQRLSRLRAADYLALAGPEVVLTPNAPEAAWLLGIRRASLTAGWAEDAARRLLALGFLAVVVKGGHLRGQAVDVVADGSGVRLLDGPRLGASLRGTGCRFASALAARLALGDGPREAASAAKAAVARALRARPGGGGASPLPHFTPVPWSIRST